MTSEMAILVFASIILSITLAYACWIKVRVVLLQERLFAVRDALFDAALEFECLDDPSYRYHRSLINSAIRMAPTVSVPTLVRAVLLLSRMEECDSEAKIPACPDARMADCIDARMREVASIILHFTMKHTITGRLALMATKADDFTSNFTRLFSRFIAESSRLAHS